MKSRIKHGNLTSLAIISQNSFAFSGNNLHLRHLLALPNLKSPNTFSIKSLFRIQIVPFVLMVCFILTLLESLFQIILSLIPYLQIMTVDRVGVSKFHLISEFILEKCISLIIEGVPSRQLTVIYIFRTQFSLLI